MAIVALVLWISTVAIGTYLLATAGRIDRTAAARPEAVPTAAGQRDQAAPVAQTPLAERLRPRKDDPYAPPSLRRDRDDPLPGLKELAEFAHPALAVIGLGFWVGYVVSRDRIMLVIGLGILLGAIAAGLSWFTVNRRAANRALPDDALAEGAEDKAADAAGQEADPRTAPLSFTPLVLILHTAGAALTLLFVALIVARV